MPSDEEDSILPVQSRDKFFDSDEEGHSIPKSTSTTKKLPVATSKYTSPSGTVVNNADSSLKLERKKNIAPSTVNVTTKSSFTPPSKNSDSVQGNVNRPLTALAIQRSDENTARRQSLKQSVIASDSSHALKLLIMYLGKPNTPDNMVSLDMFKSLSQKKELLAKAVSLHDGNVILRVVQFLNATLQYDLFVSILQSYPDASRQYLFFLKNFGDPADYKRLQSRLEIVDSSKISKDDVDGAHKLAFEVKQRGVLRRFHEAVSIESFERRKDSCAQFSKLELGNSHFLAKIAEKTSVLLQIQAKLDAIEAVEANSKSFIYSEFPLEGKLIGKTLGETLYHCAIYHLSSNPNTCANCEKKEKPIHLNAACIKNSLEVSDKVFQVALARALTRTRRYELVDSVLAMKGLSSLLSVGGKKVKPAVSPDRMLDVILYTLKKYGRLGMSLPPNIIKYVEMIEDPDDIEAIVKSYNHQELYETAVEVFCQRKDRSGLMSFATTIPSTMPAYDKARYRLQDPKIKWKT